MPRVLTINEHFFLKNRHYRYFGNLFYNDNGFLLYNMFWGSLEIRSFTQLQQITDEMQICERLKITENHNELLDKDFFVGNLHYNSLDDSRKQMYIRFLVKSSNPQYTISSFESIEELEILVIKRVLQSENLYSV